MEDGLISKKELLDLTGISYGQLYRWKRKSLIPEEWFIRKSAFTGQETFFPRENILARIDKIKNMKEDLSLDDIAGKFSPIPSEISINLSELSTRNIASQKAIGFFSTHHEDHTHFSFPDLLLLHVIDKLLQSGDLNLDEIDAAARTLENSYKDFEKWNCDLIVMRKLGVSVCIVAPSDLPVLTESGAKIILRLNMAACIEELKLRI
ncbi:MAG TPA: YhbD family protein [Bacteroidota bacterium]|nr:YhbD family protein [Bacteroidota bacterium]